MLPHALALDDDPEAGAEEERRLLYVGMTRAMDELVLTCANLRLHFGESHWQTPSRFLAEIPGEWLARPGLDQAEPSEPRVVMSEEESLPEALAVGTRVEHDHFGYGIVERVQGSGHNLKATVVFTSAGTKVLLLQYAKLRVVRR